MLSKIWGMIAHGEEGHAQTLPAMLGAGAGAIILAIGAANDSGITTIVGGIVLAIGIIATSVSAHMFVDYDLYARIEKLEGKK